MFSNRHLFFEYVAQTSPTPYAVEIERAEGVFLHTPDGKKYIDLISGVSVSNIGHGNQAVKNAIKEQVDKYMHLMVYGEYIQTPQTKYAKLLTDLLPTSLNNVYFVNSGTEANEGAIKLAKRFTGRSEVIAFKNAYHGGTHATLSLMSNEKYTQAFRPLVPGVRFLNYNNLNDLDLINKNTACVIAEVVQAEAGIIPANQVFLQELRTKCTEQGAMLIFDEIQTGIGRTGSVFAFEQYNVVPDILTTAKALGGGMPLGAFISAKKIMQSLSKNPILGHITTFGGHPVCCAAGYAALKYLTDNHIVETVIEKGEYFKSKLNHRKIKSVRGKGLLIAVELGSFEAVYNFIQKGIEIGFLSDWFLNEDTFFRVAPPLTITKDEIDYACNLINEALN